MTRVFPYSDTNKRYHTYSYALKQRFGKKVSRIGLDGGFTCPNLDGEAGVGGCAFCGGGNSPPFFAKTIPAQFQAGVELMGRKWDTDLHIAYLQNRTNTYFGRGASPEEGLARLREIYDAALSCPGVVGLAVATRPDCLPEAVCDLLADYAGRTYLTVELGLQTIHDETGRRMNRGHGWETFLRGYERLRERGIHTGIHLINGLPGETREMMVESVREAGKLRPHLLKLHMLYVAQGTALMREWAEGRVPLLTKEAFVELVCDQLEQLSPDCILGRLTGDSLPENLLAPMWTLEKRSVLNGIDKEMAKRNSWQGKRITN